ncbi:MAG: NAD(+)/NADH kinase [Blautia sp.]|nr:NAD(+)/NADH kinase [Blautia sp.]
MKKFYIITNKDKDQDLLVTEMVRTYLAEHGCSCSVRLADQKHEGAFRYTDPQEIPADTDCILVLGGDGTLLQAARDLVHVDVPLLGINLGEMGYLAEVDRQSVYPALNKLLTDSFEIEERMMLTGTVYRKDEIIGQDIALNDIVIGREGHLRVVRFNNFVNSEYLNSYNADGIIVATPTGSTGYSLSVGGPVISPDASMILMTPVAPHTMNARSIILPPEDVITVELGEGRHNDRERGLASFDGDTMIPMVTGDRIVIRRAEDRTRIVKLNRLSFVEVLRRKMRNS